MGIQLTKAFKLDDCNQKDRCIVSTKSLQYEHV